MQIVQTDPNWETERESLSEFLKGSNRDPAFIDKCLLAIRSLTARRGRSLEPESVASKVEKFKSDEKFHRSKTELQSYAKAAEVVDIADIERASCSYVQLATKRRTKMLHQLLTTPKQSQRSKWHLMFKLYVIVFGCRYRE